MVILFYPNHIGITTLWIHYSNGGIIFRKMVKNVENSFWKYATIDDQVYAIHMHATGLELNKTQMIVLYKLYHYNSELCMCSIIYTRIAWPNDELLWVVQPGIQPDTVLKTALDFKFLALIFNAQRQSSMPMTRDKMYIYK